MSRIALAYVDRDPALYVRPHSTHTELEKAIRLHKPFFLIGEPQGGVSRTLHQFRKDMRGYRTFGAGRETIAIDLFPTRHMHLAELLVLVRNSVVETVDRVTRFENVEAYFHDFDMCWAIWKHLAQAGEDRVIRLRPSKRRRLEGRLGKKVFVLTAGSLFETLGIVKDIMEFSAVSDKLTGTAIETGAESWYERQSEALGDYFARNVGLRMRRRLRGLVSGPDVKPSHVAEAMAGLLGEAIVAIQEKVLKGRKRLAFAIDAIDELNADVWPNVRKRGALCSIVLDGLKIQIGSVFAGRTPSAGWRLELASADADDVRLLPYARPDVSRAWETALEEAVLDEMLGLAYGEDTHAVGGRLSAAWNEVMERRGLA